MQTGSIGFLYQMKLKSLGLLRIQAAVPNGDIRRSVGCSFSDCDIIVLTDWFKYFSPALDTSRWQKVGTSVISLHTISPDYSQYTIEGLALLCLLLFTLMHTLNLYVLLCCIWVRCGELNAVTCTSPHQLSCPHLQSCLPCLRWRRL